MLLEPVRDGVDDRAGEEHPRLRGVDADVVRHRVELRADERRRQLEDRVDADRVLRRERDDRRHAVGAGGGERLEVGLDPGAAAGVGARDRERCVEPTPPFAGTTRIRFDGCDLSLSRHPGARTLASRPCAVCRQPSPRARRRGSSSCSGSRPAACSSSASRGFTHSARARRLGRRRRRARPVWQARERARSTVADAPEGRFDAVVAPAGADLTGIDAARIVLVDERDALDGYADGTTPSSSPSVRRDVGDARAAPGRARRTDRVGCGPARTQSGSPSSAGT